VNGLPVKSHRPTKPSRTTTARTMTYTQTILASVIGGGVVGVFALAGVVYTSHRAATAAAAADRRAAAAEAADRRHAAAEQARWAREQRIAAYLEYVARVDAQTAAGHIVRAILRSPNPPTAFNVDQMELFRRARPPCRYGLALVAVNASVQTQLSG
jgi:hypothetical protein